MDDVDIALETRIARLSELGLIEDPFKLNADPKYLYLGQDHLSAYRQLQNVISRRRGLALITGGPGLGKSSLARRIFELYYNEPGYDVAYIPSSTFSTKMDAARTISAALHSLHIPARHSYASQMEDLQTAIADAYTEKRNVIIILDDAQLMVRPAMTVLHQLYNFDFDQKAVQVLAFGQEETVPLFRKYPALDSRIFVRSSLKPLSLANTLLMINYRVRTAGRREPLFEDNALAYMYERSGGIPREIVRFCALATDYILEQGLSLVNMAVATEVAKIYEDAT